MPGNPILGRLKNAERRLDAHESRLDGHDKELREINLDIIQLTDIAVRARARAGSRLVRRRRMKTSR